MIVWNWVGVDLEMGFNSSLYPSRALVSLQMRVRTRNPLLSIVIIFRLYKSYWLSFGSLAMLHLQLSYGSINGLQSPILMELDITFCDFQASNSPLVSWNIKSSGNRSINI